VRTRESRVGRAGARSLRPLAAALVLVLAAAGGWYAWSRSRAATPAADETPDLAAATRTIEVASEPPGAAIFVGAEDTGLVTPAFVPLDGADGDVVSMHLRIEGATVASTQLVLGQSLPPQWAPALAAAPARLTLVSEPAGAQVTVGDESLATPTPVEVVLRPGEPQEVRLELDGYEPLVRTLDLDRLEPAERAAKQVLVNLRKAIPPGFVRVAAAYPVEVEVDGRRRSGSPVSLPPGRYRVRFLAPSVFYSETREVEIASGGTVEVSLPAAVPVTVAATPGNCKVAIDGRDVGFVPAAIEIVPGAHEFRFEWAGVDKSLTVTEEIGPDTVRVFRAAPDS
jgi:hypothetical protein